MDLQFTKISNELERQINKDLSDIEKWLNNWRLRMAPEKCSYLIFSLAFGKKGKKEVKKEERS